MINFGGTGAILAAVIMTIIILVFAEILPRTFAVTYPERISLALAPALTWARAVAGNIPRASATRSPKRVLFIDASYRNPQ
jgi:Mg2+/Co2+ transporter CorB